MLASHERHATGPRCGVRVARELTVDPGMGDARSVETRLRWSAAGRTVAGMRVLDRIPHFDDRSHDYGIGPLLSGPAVPRREQVWTTRTQPLNQGQEGACVAFAISGELAAQPVDYKVDNEFARSLYPQIRAQDQAMGNNWPQGASVLAGAKMCQRMGMITSYRWAFGVSQVIDALIDHGPVVLGIPWFDSMYRTGPGGQVSLGGALVGGHAIMAHGYLPSHPQFGEVVAWTNSWGPSYGVHGVGYVRVSDLAMLLAQSGEACVLTDHPLRPSSP